MWLSLKLIVLVPCSLLLIDFGIATHERSLLGSSFLRYMKVQPFSWMSLYELMILRAATAILGRRRESALRMTLNSKWSKIELQISSPSPIPVFHSIFPVAKARLFGVPPNFTVWHPTFCSLKDPMSSSFKLYLHFATCSYLYHCPPDPCYCYFLPTLLW